MDPAVNKSVFFHFFEWIRPGEKKSKSIKYALSWKIPCRVIIFTMYFFHLIVSDWKNGSKRNLFSLSRSVIQFYYDGDPQMYSSFLYKGTNWMFFWEWEWFQTPSDVSKVPRKFQNINNFMALTKNLLMDTGILTLFYRLSLPPKNLDFCWLDFI